MAGSLTLIVVGIVLLTGNWNAAYAIACIVAGAVWWHVSEHAHRVRLAAARPAPVRVEGVRKAAAIVCAGLEIVAVLVAGGAAFDHAERGLFGAFSADALVMFCSGLALLFAASQLNALKQRLDETMLATWFGERARPVPPPWRGGG
jgi:hypothetical protein